VPEKDADLDEDKLNETEEEEVKVVGEFEFGHTSFNHVPFIVHYILCTLCGVELQMKSHLNALEAEEKRHVS
jgi:hypothetical protein